MRTISHESNKLSTKDLVTTGIYCAVFLVFMLLGGGLFAPNPILTFAMPCVVALLTGPIYLMLVAKVPKHGPIIILGVLMGIIMLVTGMYWLWAVAFAVLGVIADLIASIGGFKRVTLNIISFVVFSLNPMGSYIMLWIDRKNYFSYMVEKGTEQSYVEVMGSVAQNWMLPLMIVSIIVAALISSLVGKALLRNQFEKAGMTA